MTKVDTRKLKPSPDLKHLIRALQDVRVGDHGVSDAGAKYIIDNVNRHKSDQWMTFVFYGLQEIIKCNSSYAKRAGEILLDHLPRMLFGHELDEWLESKVPELTAQIQFARENYARALNQIKVRHMPPH
ncbi:hypothetical protein COT97_03075 [Candidatus Falkowbacteria bacterium CG10_big_fil_rev_8_21_14_0_10_39_11]|uniref:Uncharacterized protein n=1 Tax=Candidatus Falkowbacteria bacterium CG10_big_fil_rev_8_21_14_0_10_39_11 TaxID=1974565 RepID=A0A2H0V4U9_9BACT|nr:MAG: hypothetical protein COT97_03075 [Candidatus Falkowbacteria bacterium CG10_big_fil_rev_8_21_14_0_10_39_11]